MLYRYKKGENPCEFSPLCMRSFAFAQDDIFYLESAPAISTAIATVAPTIGICCLWRVMAAFVVNVSELPFTHLHITCPIPRKPIISTCAGTDA